MSEKERYKQIYSTDILPIYFHPDWLDIVSGKKWDARIVKKNGLLQGVFVFGAKRKYGMRYFLNFQYTPYTGYYFMENNKEDQLAQKRIIDALHRKLDLDYEYFFLQPLLKNAYPFIMNGYHIQTKYSYVKKLQEEDLLESMNSRMRSTILKNQDSLDIEISDDIDTLISFHNNAYTSNTQPYNSAILKKLYQRFSPDNMFIIEAKKNGVSKGAILISHDQNRAYYIAGGSDGDLSYTMSLMLYYAMYCCQKMKIRYFDFHGSSIPSIERFFRKFNPEVETYLGLIKRENVKGRFIDFFVKH